MKFRKLKSALFRIGLRLKAKSFYEDIIFEDWFVKICSEKVIEKWFYNLSYYKNTRIKKFKDLFNEFDEVVFPIRIICCHGSYVVELEFIDSEGKKYYFSQRGIYEYRSMQKYIIGRRNSTLEPFVDRDFYYSISEDKEIILLQTTAMKLNCDGTNGKAVVYFCYDDPDVVEVKLKSYSSDKKIIIKYPSKNSSDTFDKNLLEFLFGINEQDRYYYNIFLILKRLMELMTNIEDITLSITVEIEDGETWSQMDIVNGMVQQYIATKKVIEGETEIIKKTLSKDLKTFLMDNGE